MKTVQGFTLIELMAVVAVAAILLIVAVPNMRAFVQNNRITGAANQVHASISLARGEALKRARPITFQTVATGGAGNEFGNGWRIYRDTDADLVFDSGEDLIAQVDALPGGTTLDTSPNTTSIVFNAQGIPQPLTTTTFQMRIPDCRGNQGRNIQVTNVGRITVSTVGC